MLVRALEPGLKPAEPVADIDLWRLCRDDREAGGVVDKSHGRGIV